MYFTREDYLKIEEWLKLNAIKDTEFKDAELPVKELDTITLVQDGKNVKVSLKDFIDLLFNLGVSDFLNITDKYKQRNITIEQAINLIPSRARKKGQVITFLNSDSKWVLYQFKGELNQWNIVDLWDNIFDINKYIINSIIPDEEDLTMSLPDSNGNSHISLKDREYNPQEFSGKGRIILRKNIEEFPVDGAPSIYKNVLYLDMINLPNTIYEIRYDFDLNGQEITIPEGCVLDFKGGSLSNGNIVYNNNTIKGYLLYHNVNHTGNILNNNINLKDFSFKDDNSIFDFLNSQNFQNKNIYFENRFYYINKQVINKGWVNIINTYNLSLFGNNCTIVDVSNRPKINAKVGLLFIENSKNIRITDFNFFSTFDIEEQSDDYQYGFVRTVNTIDNLYLNCTINNADYSIYSGYWNAINNKNICGNGLINSTIIVNAANFRYSASVEYGNNIIINSKIDKGHRGLYLAGVQNCDIHLEGTANLKSGTFVLLTDTAVYNNDTQSFVGCNNIRAIIDNNRWEEKYLSSNITCLSIQLYWDYHFNTQRNKFEFWNNIDVDIIISNINASSIKNYTTACAVTYGTSNGEIISTSKDFTDIINKLKINIYDINNKSSNYKILSVIKNNNIISNIELTVFKYNSTFENRFLFVDGDNITLRNGKHYIICNDNKNYVSDNFNGILSLLGDINITDLSLINESISPIINIDNYKEDTSYCISNNINSLRLNANILTSKNFNAKDVTKYKDGYMVYDTTNNIPFFVSKGKRYNALGIESSVNQSGLFSNRPTSEKIPIGFEYFCSDKQTTEGATNGIMIYHKGNNVWVDALGRVVS